MHLQPLLLGHEIYSATTSPKFSGRERGEIIAEPFISWNQVSLNLRSSSLWWRVVLLEYGMLRRNQYEKAQQPLLLREALPHILGKLLPLLGLLFVFIITVIFNNRCAFVSQYGCCRWVHTGENLDLAQLWAVAFPLVDVLQHLHGDKLILPIHGQEVAVAEERLVQLVLVLDDFIEVFLTDHIYYYYTR